KAEATEPIQQQIAAAQGQIQSIRAEMAGISGEEEGDAERLAALEEALAAAQTGLETAQGALETVNAQFAPQEAELAGNEQAVNGGLAQLDAKEAELKAGEAAIADGRKQLDAAEAELKAAEDSYPANQSKIFDAQWTINDGWWQLQKGREDYEEGKLEAEQELRDAEQELHDAEQELADARAEVEEDLRLEVFTLDRDSNPGYLTFGNDIRIVDGLANAFPVFFTLVAALVCVTTMTRMVGEERTLIGTMKALGYSGGVVMSKYLLYSCSAALLGCVAGFFLGTSVIPYLVWIAYGILYDYARLDFYFGPLMAALCLAASVLVTLLVTWLACRQELREKPAELIRPKAPKAGKRIFLEYLGPLWRRLPFLSKVSLRNAFRHPLRVLMLLLGIGGCTALLVAGFGVRDSVSHISDYQYGEIFLYDLSVSLDTDDFTDDASAAALWQDETSAWSMTRQEPVTLYAGDREKSSRLIAAADGALEGMISLHDEQGELPFPQAGQAVITEKIAETLDLRVGDSLTLVTDGGERLEVQVSGVCKNYLNHYVFLNAASLKQAQNNTALLRVREGVDENRLGARLRAAEGVDYVSLSSQERETMERSMASLDLLVLLLVVCSGALAFITLYNLTNINIMERTREIATVKVLGFFPGETASYVLRENRLLAVLGAALGLALGKLLHYVVIRAVVVEYMSFDVRITPLSYAI
ncbi:MAG: ABC transporter permease, partial [Firmicutes bacterium]|nr:ABC transporter permease [Bacillota bacterium]